MYTASKYAAAHTIMRDTQVHASSAVNLGAYLGEVEHPEVGVHVHGASALARLAVQLGRLAKATLVRVDVAQEDLRVVLAALATLLSHTHVLTSHNAPEPRKQRR